MLENCKDLQTCENRLAEAVEQIRLLGELPLSDEDIEILTRLVKNAITPNISKGTRLFRTKYPVSLASFLVSMGRFYNKEVGFWPIVEEKVGQLYTNWKVEWGQVFNNYLQDKDLPKFDEEDGLTYVTPILAHTCIPDCCLEEYFGQILVPLTRELHYPLDQQEILHDLRVRRRINDCRLKLEKKKKEYTKQLVLLKREKRNHNYQIEKFEEVAALLIEEEACRKRRVVFSELDNVEHTRENLLSNINDILENIQRLELDEQRLLKEIANFKLHYQPILQIRPQIDDAIPRFINLNKELIEAFESEKQITEAINSIWEELSPERWNERFGIEILQLPLEQILIKIERFEHLQEKKKLSQSKLAILEASQKETNKRLNIILSFWGLIVRPWFWFRLKNSTTKKSKIKELQGAYSDIEKRLELSRNEIEGFFKGIPIKEQLVKCPTHNLYEKLDSLQRLLKRFVEFQSQYVGLETKEVQFRKQVRDLLLSIDIYWDGNLKTLADIWGDVLKDAEQCQTATRETERILENKIRPDLEEARIDCQGLSLELNGLDQQLVELGGGSLEKGLHLVQEFNRLQESCAQIRQALDLRYPDFHIMESELNSQGWEKIRDNLNIRGSKVEDNIHFLKSELQQIENSLNHYPVQYFGIDEPIRRFLLYGGITAERYFINTIMLFVQAKSGKRIEDVSSFQIPPRIIEHSLKWWGSNRIWIEPRTGLEEETTLPTGERFRAPQISFDIAMGEVTIVFPTQRVLRHDDGTTVHLDVFCPDLSTPIYSSPLKLYKWQEGLVETSPLDEIILSKPSEKYIFRLKSKDKLIREWEIKGLSETVPFLAFYQNSKKQVKGESLPKSSIILVIQNNFRVHPHECVLTEGSALFGDWKEYVCYEVDLSTIDELYLLNDSGRDFKIPLISDPSSDVALVGGNQLTGVVSNDQPVFDLPPEFIRVYVHDQEQLHLLRISLFDEIRPEKSKHYQGDELINLFNKHGDGWFDIPLKVEEFLGVKPIGYFTLRVYQPSYFDWKQSFIIVPKLKMTFDKEVYIPYRDKVPNITATLALPEMSKFKPENPAKLLLNNGKLWVIQAPASENKITGMFSSSTVCGEEIKITLTFFIPKIRWCLKGLVDPQFDNWFDEVKEELWIGDWLDAQDLFLIVEVPWFYSGEMFLILPGNSVLKKLGKVHNQKVRIDLKALEDTLRTGQFLETVTVSLKGCINKFSDIPLFTVRTRWQVEDKGFTCHHSLVDDTARVEVSWKKEKGKADQVSVRLWRLSDNIPKLIQEQSVPAEKKKAIFKKTSLEIAPGIYLIHLVPDDPWASTITCPKLNDLNTKIIEIDDPYEKALDIQSVVVDPKHSYCLPPGSYRIKIIGKVINQKLPIDFDVEHLAQITVTPLNENWYVGKLDVKGIPNVKAYLSDTNPVKFEYDTQKCIVTSIEDRHGDGAVYCYDCKMLFWSQEMVEDEKKKGHKNYGPIEEFKVKWENE